MDKTVKTTYRPILKAVLFDLDGTLVHSTVNFIKLKNQTIDHLTREGLSPNLFSTEMKTYDILQLASVHLKKRGYLEQDVARVFNKIEWIWNRIELESVNKTVCINGVKKTLRKLKECGLKIGVVTRGCRQYAKEALQNSSLLNLVDVIVGRDDAPPKPRPDPLIKALRMLGFRADEAVMIGDGIDDAQCAKSSKVHFIGIAPEVTAKNSFLDLPCKTIIPNLTHLIRVLALS
jgi:HAD superfamily hydrolase (TIGR01549 family)